MKVNRTHESMKQPKGNAYKIAEIIEALELIAKPSHDGLDAEDLREDLKLHNKLAERCLMIIDGDKR